MMQKYHFYIVEEFIVSVLIFECWPQPISDRGINKFSQRCLAHLIKRQFQP